VTFGDVLRALRGALCHKRIARVQADTIDLIASRFMTRCRTGGNVLLIKGRSTGLVTDLATRLERRRGHANALMEWRHRWVEDYQILSTCVKLYQPSALADGVDDALIVPLFFGRAI